MSESIRDKAVVIKQEAKTIIECLDNYKNVNDIKVIKKCMHTIWNVAGEGVAQVEDLEKEWCK